MDNKCTEGTYRGRFSTLYDLFYMQKTYHQEGNFVHHCLQYYGDGSSKKILELGCGTGNHAFLLEQLGYSIVATDISEDMIAQATAKAVEGHSEIKFYCQDMIQLSRPDKPFDAVICLFDSICYVIDNDDVHELFNRIHSHLRPGGLLIFEFWNAAAMIKHLDPIRIKRLQKDDIHYLKISEAELDIKNQLYRVDYSLFEIMPGGKTNAYYEKHINRFYQVQEMAFFLAKSGFQAEKWFAGYCDCEEITSETWNVICVARAL